METFITFWNGLRPLNQWFFMGAACFSIIFLWQMIMTVIGLGSSDTDLDTHVDSTGHHDTPTDAQDTVLEFKLLSVRSIIAFATLFTWAGALYMNNNCSVPISLCYSFAWGIAAMVLVSLLIYGMRRMTETGNIQISSCVGNTGTVYLDIPAGGDGEIRILCSGIMTHIKARLSGGKSAKAGTIVKVIKVSGPNSVEVEIDNSSTKGEEKK
jgi:hypothetical protein